MQNLDWFLRSAGTTKEPVGMVLRFDGMDDTGVASLFGEAVMVTISGPFGLAFS